MKITWCHSTGDSRAYYLFRKNSDRAPMTNFCNKIGKKKRKTTSNTVVLKNTKLMPNLIIAQLNCNLNALKINRSSYFLWCKIFFLQIGEFNYKVDHQQNGEKN